MIEKDLVDPFLDTEGGGWTSYSAGAAPAWYRARHEYLEVMLPLAVVGGPGRLRATWVAEDVSWGETYPSALEVMAEGGWDPIDEEDARRQLQDLTPPCATWAPQEDGSLVLTRVEEDR
jgi:hypothetical protein